MRETDIIANEKFNGNVNVAIEYILRNMDNNFINKESALWNMEESNFALSVVKQIAIEKKGKKYVDCTTPKYKNKIKKMYANKSLRKFKIKYFYLAKRIKAKILRIFRRNKNNV